MAVEVGFVLPDEPQGTLKYEQGKKAQVVGEPHKHFGLGLLAGRGPSQLNDLGTELKRFETYAGLPVIVKLYEVPSDPERPKEGRLFDGNKYTKSICNYASL